MPEHLISIKHKTTRGNAQMGITEMLPQGKIMMFYIDIRK